MSEINNEEETVVEETTEETAVEEVETQEDSVTEMGEEVPEVEFITVEDETEDTSKADEFVQTSKEFLNKSKDAVEDGIKKIQENENVQKGLDKSKEVFEKGVEAAVDLSEKTVDYVKNNENLRDVAVKVGTQVENVVESEPVQKAVAGTKDFIQKSADSIKELFSKKGDN